MSELKERSGVVLALSLKCVTLAGIYMEAVVLDFKQLKKHEKYVCWTSGQTHFSRTCY